MKDLIEDVIEFLISKEFEIKDSMDEIIYNQGSPLNERLKPLTVSDIKRIEELRIKYQKCVDLIDYLDKE